MKRIKTEKPLSSPESVNAVSCVTGVLCWEGFVEKVGKTLKTLHVSCDNFNDLSSVITAVF